ncbi:MAG: galactitol-1-phosphate 5-dehydrogenase [Candidatus Atribacteria bacterium]|nr:galactitol-1-phosphate 5-dehydrogenase [Candidatus Atribacteria bacterium]MCD6349530.1 galactitol-1-phosphate 5-dehydrogenase [Candidatus Atribacteria bacterium]
MSRMRALVLKDKGRLVLEEVDLPQPGAGEVLVKVGACGVCGSDLPRIFGDLAYFYPLIPGHEFAGEVVKAGCELGEEWIGKRVTVYPLIPCRKCPFCESGYFELCDNYDYLGSRRNGAFAEYVIAPVTNLVALPEGVSLEEGALTEPAAVTLHAVRRSLVSPGDRVAVFGLGPIGLLTAHWVRLAGASSVVGFEVDSRRKDFARRFAFDAVLSPDEEKTALFDKVFEASGNASAFLRSISRVQKRGTLVLLGNQEREFTVSPRHFSLILRKEIKLLGSWNSHFTRFDSDWERVLLLAQRGKEVLKKVISHLVPLKEAPDFLNAMLRKEVFYSKVIIAPWAEGGVSVVD